MTRTRFQLALRFAVASLRSACAVVGCGVGFGLLAGTLGALEIPGEETKIFPSNPVPASGMYSRFGAAIDLEDRWLVVGAPNDDVDPLLNRAGAVYVFERVGAQWIERQKLTAPVPTTDDFFGIDVGIALGPGGLEDFIIVGAPGADTASFIDVGKAYVYKRDVDEWVLDQVLQHTDPANFDEFGFSVDIDVSIPANSPTGDYFYTAVVGAPETENPTFWGQGSIVIFQYVGGPPAFQETYQYFGTHAIHLGFSVAIDHGLIMAGAPEYDYQGGGLGVNSGAVGLYGRGNNIVPHYHWSWAGWLVVEDYNPASLMGEAVDLEWSPPFGVSGSKWEDGGGAVYAYDLLAFGDRTEFQKIDNPESYGAFGASVAMDGSLLAVGDPWFNDLAANLQGAVYLYRFDGIEYVLIARIHSTDLVFNEIGYARAVTLDDGVLATGAPGEGSPVHVERVYVNEMNGLIFSDGFETGDTTAWVVTSP